MEGRQQVNQPFRSTFSVFGNKVTGVGEEEAQKEEAHASTF